MTVLKKCLQIFTLIIISLTNCIGQNVYDTLSTVNMTAIVDSQSLNLTIQWKDDPGNNSYSLYKKLRQDTSWGLPIMTTVDQDSSYLDDDIIEGELYEYRIIKQTGNSLGYAYLFSGVNYLPPQNKGDILLLIDSIAADFVSDNLTEYMNILRSEGWKPSLALLPEDAGVQYVKSLIIQYYGDVDDLRSVLLMGNIAVPHSGNINPDGHGDHKGAWPADLYYGDIDGIWTDQTVDNVSSAYPRIHNVPGDGNFDQDTIPGEVELVIGRFDFSELPVFDLDQYELLDRYLQKNIDFRTGQYQASRRAIYSNLNPWVGGLGQNAIRNFIPLFSSDSIWSDDYFDAFHNSFLWSYGASSGSMICSNGFGCISTYADNNFQAVFTANFGSYFGDYDYENNFLRTMLGSGKVLSAAWVGAPNWYFHPMGMGLDLGYCTLLTQNNSDIYFAGFYPKAITINLLGDPTLKAFVVRPPNNLIAVQDGNQMELKWSPSEENNILGYQVLKKNEGDDYFEALNVTPIPDTSFIDSCVIGEEQVQYLVKAVKQEITASGSFINHSTGPIITTLTSPSILPEADFDLIWEDGILTAENLSANAGQYHWILPDGTLVDEEDFQIPYNQTAEINVTLIASNACFSDTLQQILTISDLTDPVEDNEIYIYPNPAKKFIIIETNKHIGELHFYNPLGILVSTQSDLYPGVHFVNLANLARGNYFFKIHLKNKVITKNVIVE